MISGVLTLFNWTLRMDSKSIYPHVVRAVFAFGIMFSISIAFVDVFGTSSIGLRFFESVCTMNVILITISGISYFVSAVTEEKDAGTYALLRLAGMSSLSIILGKSTSRLVSSLMLLVVQVPFTFLAITLGGVLWQQIVAAYLAMAAWMILVANLALFCSVRCATSGRAAGLAGSLLGLYLLLPRLINAGLFAMPAGALPSSVTAFLRQIPVALAEVSVVDRLTDILGLTSGFTLFGIQWSSRAAGPAAGYGAVELVDSQFWLSLFASLVLFIVSTLTLDFWSAPGTTGGLSEKRQLRRWEVSRCWPWAIAWKEFLFFTGGRFFAIAKLLAGGLLFAGYLFYAHLENPAAGVGLTGDLGWIAFLTFAFILTVEILLYSSGCLFFEMRQQTHSNIATLPMSSVRVLLEKLFGCAIALTPSIFWIIVTGIVGRDSIVRYCSFTMVISWMIMMGFSSHVAVLLSLYTRWAALPLTVLFSMPAFLCLSAPLLGLTTATAMMVQSSSVELTVLLTALVDLFWTWLFLLLPLQLWIRDRWITVSHQ